MERKPTAQDKRIAALRALSQCFLTEEGKLTEAFTVTPVDVHDAIEELRELGRTERWQAALTKWQGFVKDYENDLHFAIVQGSMFALWAA